MHQLFVILILLTPLLLLVLVVKWTHYYRSKKSRFPFEIVNTHRIPGYHLLRQYHEAKIDLFVYIILLQYLTALPFVAHVIGGYMGKPSPTWVYVVILPPVFIYIFYKLGKIATNTANFRLGLEAEWFVAHQLSELSNQGYRAFHDVQADGFNIDHLVVGPNGIFAIETKGRRKPGSSKKANPLEDKSHSAKVSGNIIEFPNYKDDKSIAQAIRQAKWCSDWLSQAVGQPINVMPVVTLPGWYIEYNKTKSAVPVLSGKALPSNLPKLQSCQLNPQQISQVIYQVKQRVGRENDEL